MQSMYKIWIGASLCIAACGEPASDDEPQCEPGLVACGDDCIEPPEPRLAELQTTIFAGCNFQACHGQNKPQEMLEMSSAEVSHGELVDVPAIQRPDLLRVEPGAPERSYLIHKLRGIDMADTSSGSPSVQMPIGAPPLCEARIAAVEAWIRNGAEP